MIKINNKIIDELTKPLLFKLNNSEKKQLIKEFNDLSNMLAQIKKITCKNVVPTANVHQNSFNQLRSDDLVSEFIDSSSLLNNSKNIKDRFVVIKNKR